MHRFAIKLLKSVSIAFLLGGGFFVTVGVSAAYLGPQTITTKSVGSDLKVSEFNAVLDVAKRIFTDDTANPNLYLGPTTAPAQTGPAGTCPAGYDFYDFNGNAEYDAGECWKGITIVDGEVGIGQAVPTEVLDVVGNVKLSGNFIDSFVTGGVALGETGQTSLTGYTATSIVGALNEVGSSTSTNSTNITTNASNITDIYGTLLGNLNTISNMSSLGIVQTNASGVVSTSMTLPDGVLATTQSASDNSTKVATTAYVDTAMTGVSSNRIENTATTSYLEFGTSGGDAFITGHSILVGDNSIFTLEDNSDVKVFDVNAQGSIFNNNSRVFSFDGTNNNLFISDERANDTKLGSAYNNIVIGSGSGANISTAQRNVLIGPSSGLSVVENQYNISIGQSSDVIGSDAVAIGGNAVAASGSVSIGRYAGGSSSGSNNVTIGYSAGFDISFSGTYNTLLGYRSGYSLTSGARNIFLGSDSGYYETGSDKLLVSSLTSIQQTDETTARTKAIIYGVNNTTTANQTLALNAQVKATYGLEVGAGTTATAGLIQWDGSNFQGYNGSSWTNLDAQGGSAAGSDGEIQFASSGAFTADSNLFWDDTNNRLGIGTVTPETGIHLSVNGPNAQMKVTTTSASGLTTGGGFIVSSEDGAAMSLNDRLGYFLFQGSRGATGSSNGAGVVAYADENWVDGSSYGTRFQFETVANGETLRNPRMTIASGGNVGIGTTSPGGKLVVVGEGTTSATYGLNVTDSGGSSNLFVRDDGNVGIGISAPTQALEVVGNIKLSGDLFDTYITAGISLGETGAAALDGTFTATSIIGGLNELKTSITTNTDNIDTNAVNISDIYTTLSGNLDTVSGLSSAGVLQSDASGNVTSSMTLMNGVLATTQTAADNSTKVATTAYVDSAVGGASSDVIIEGDTSVETIDTGVDGNIVFKTENAEAMRIDENGNVGIGGIATPNSKLQLEGSFAVKRTATAASVSTGDEVIIGVTDTSVARTITLSTADAVAGRMIIIKDESGLAGTNNITIATEGAETIDGAASVAISVNYGVLRVYSNGTNWFAF